MIIFIIRRLFLGLFTLWVISIIAFVIVQLPPGDFVDLYVEELLIGNDLVKPAFSLAFEEALRDEFGLDQPVIVQYGKWVWKVVRLDFGISLAFRRPVMEIVADRLLMTVILAAATILFTWVLAIPIGIYTSVRQYSVEDYTFTFIGFLGLAVPDFLLALVLLWVSFAWFDSSVGGLFSAKYQVAPWSAGRVVDLLSHLWIPALVLGTAGTAALIRIMRANLLDELHKPYVVTARSKGVPEWKLILKYPVRIALNPLVSGAAYLFPFLLSGSVIVSVVLGLPTVGPLLLRALMSEDLFMASTIVILLGGMTVVGTLISDIVLAIVDPRIRMEQR